MPSVEAIYTSCEDIMPHDAHVIGTYEYCIGISDDDGKTEDLKHMIDRISHDHNISKREAERIGLAELRFLKVKEEKVQKNAERFGNVNLQTHHEGQLGADR